MSYLPRARGAALIMVLWLTAGLALLVLAGAQAARQHTQRVALELERQRAESVLDGALALTASQLVANKSLARSYRLLQLTLDGVSVQVEVVPASGLVDINVADPRLLEALFQRVGGLSPGEAAVLRSRVQDFVDADDEPGGVGGAEAAQYVAAGSPARPRNSGLEDLSELRAVLGMSPELYEIIAPFLGLNGGQRLNAAAAPPALIDALTGQTGLGARWHATAPDMRTGLLPEDVSDGLFITASPAEAYTVKMRAFLHTSTQRGWERQTWLDLGARPDSMTAWTTRSLEPVRRMSVTDSLRQP